MRVRFTRDYDYTPSAERRVTIAHKAGYGVAAPPALVQALKLIVADFYAFRETAQIGSVAGQIPSTTTVDALLANYRKHLI